MSLEIHNASLDFSRQRLITELDTIEKATGEKVGDVLSWRPGPGRAHIAWQAMHIAASHVRFFKQRCQGDMNADKALTDAYAGGSTPSDQNVPALAQIRETLNRTFADVKQFVAGLSPDGLARIIVLPNREISVRDGIILMCWHEAHHQGQIHLTWNLYKQAKGIK